MKMLNPKKVRWIVREMDKGDRSVYRIAKTMKVTSQWARKVHRFYNKTREYLYPQRPGRKPRLVSDDVRALILETRKNHPLLGVVSLEKLFSS
jgi:transposase